MSEKEGHSAGLENESQPPACSSNRKKKCVRGNKSLSVRDVRGKSLSQCFDVLSAIKQETTPAPAPAPAPPVVKAFKCSHCEKRFKHIYNCNRHERVSHGVEHKITANLKCSECGDTFRNISVIMAHLSKVHSVRFITESKEFESLEDLLSWKSNLEKGTNTRYSLKRNYEQVDCFCKKFYCNQSGVHTSRGSGKRRSESCKSGRFCPSMITARISKSSGKAVVEFIPLHLGHECELKRAPNLTQAEKNEIAALLQAGIPKLAVKTKIAESVPQTHRLALVEMQDVRNTAVSYGLKVNPSISDTLSLDNWVKESQFDEHSPILLYKPHGEMTNYPDIETNDFLVGVMNLAQEAILKTYGGGVVSIDSTNDTKECNLQLTTLIVCGDNFEGVPVAFLWSNTKSESAIQYFLHAVKERVGNVHPEFFISDVNPTFYSAWCDVFSPAKHCFMFLYKVKYAWKGYFSNRRYNVFSSKKPSKGILEALDSLAEELDELTFLVRIEELVSQWLENKQTSSFAKYFIENYQNRAEQWAACYRKKSVIARNVKIERWHKDLKFNKELTGDCCGQLDKSVYSLMKSLQLKITNCLSCVLRTNLRKVKTLIRNTHTLAKLYECVSDSDIVTQNDGEWTIPSFTSAGKRYTVKKLSVGGDHSCKIQCDDCNVCIHRFSCSCFDSAVSYNICKHIHVICAKINVDNVKNNEMNDDSSISSFDIDNGVDHVEDHGSDDEAKSVVRSGAGDYEKKVPKEQDQKEKLEGLKQSAISAVFSFIEEVEKFTSDEQFKEVIKQMPILKTKCQSLA